jgi:hypothetical protein
VFDALLTSVAHSCTLLVEDFPLPKKKQQRHGPDPRFGDKMEKRISAVVTEGQLAGAKKVASAAGKTVSTWARDVLLKAIREGK